MEAQQVDLPSACPFVSTKGGEHRIELGQALADRTKIAQIDSGELIECIPLGLNRKEPLVVVLTVHVDERRPKLFKLTDGRQSSVDICPRSTVLRNHAREDHLLITDDESALHARLFATRPHHRCVSPCSNEERDRLDDHRLPRTSFSGDGSQAPTEIEAHIFNHTEVLDVQLDQHYSSPRPNFWRTI